MKLSVVILNYNVAPFLQLCLDSVQKAINGLNAEIIVVDNNSTDNSCEMVKAYFPEIRLIENKENSGFSKGNNIGVATAKGDYVCILNPDTVVPQDVFSKLLAFADSKPNLGIVSCKLLDGNGNFLPESKRNLPTPKVSLKKMLGFSESYYTNHISENEIAEASIFVGAFMLIKTDVYNAVGGFDEDYFMYGEDIDLSYKVLQAGYKNWYNGAVSVIHFKGESTLKDKVYAERFYGAMQLFYKKHFKSNPLFNAIVWLGIKVASKRKINDSVNGVFPSKYVLISSKPNYKLQIKKGVSVLFKKQIETHNLQTQYIFDVSYLDYKTLIAWMESSDETKNYTFRFLCKQPELYIGSDNSKSRGEALFL